MYFAGFKLVFNRLHSHTEAGKLYDEFIERIKLIYNINKKI